MKLIQIEGDVYVAKDVSAILVEEEEVTVILRGLNEGIDYEFDSEEMAKRQVADAVKVLMSLDNV